jgi:predicted aspartyl protease
MRKNLEWVIIGVVFLILGALLTRSGGRFISYEFDYFPEERLKGLIGSGATEGEIELRGALEVTTSARWYQLSRRFFPGILLVDAKVNGRKVSLVLDTGSNITVLAPQVAVEAGIVLSDKRGKSLMWGREVPIYLGYAQELKLGNLAAHNVPVVVCGSIPTFKLLGIPMYHDDDFLGMNLLQHLAIHLDLLSGAVTFSREPLPSKGPSAPLHVIKEPQDGLPAPLPIVEGFIGDSGPFSFLFDTGASEPVLVGEEIWQALGLGEEKKVTLERVQLGEIELHNVPAIRDRAEHRRKIILLGNNVLLANGYKRLTLDFLAEKLYAER